MMQFKINLATRTYVNATGVKSAFTVVGILLGGWLVLNVLSITQNLYEIKRIKKEEVVIANAGKDGRQFTAREIQDIGERVKFVNSIYKTGTTGWLALLNDLEMVTPDGVAIKNINRGKDGEIKISGTARNFKLVRAFMENASDSKKFRDIYLVSQGSAKLGKKQTGTSFTINCKAVN
jgi:type IV pilus assembly protein PilN